MRAFRKLLSAERNPHCQAVIDAGVVPRFVEFLQIDRNPTLQFEAAWCLTNVASGTAAQCAKVVQHNAIPPLVGLLGSTNEAVRMWRCSANTCMCSAIALTISVCPACRAIA